MIEMKTVNLPDEIHHSLKVLAAKQGTTMTELVVACVTPLLQNGDTLPRTPEPQTPPQDPPTTEMFEGEEF